MANGASNRRYHIHPADQDVGVRALHKASDVIGNAVNLGVRTELK